MSQPTWEARQQPNGWVVVHALTNLRVGKCLGREEAMYLLSALKALLPVLDVETATAQNVSTIRALREAAMSLRPNRSMKKYLVTVTMKVPVWADGYGEAHNLFQEMVYNDEIFSYTNEFEPEVSIAEVTEPGYEDPEYAVTSDGLEEVERLPYVPTYDPPKVLPDA